MSISRRARSAGWLFPCLFLVVSVLGLPCRLRAAEDIKARYAKSADGPMDGVRLMTILYARSRRIVYSPVSHAVFHRPGTVNTARRWGVRARGGLHLRYRDVWNSVGGRIEV